MQTTITESYWHFRLNPSDNNFGCL